MGGRDRGAVVIAADTAVVLEGDVLGKPADNAEAARMLHSLRGRVHTVVTGVTLLDSRSGRRLSRAKITDVTMRHYSDREIAAYIATGEHLDKAGSYAVQDETFRPAQDVHGCYLNAVGFPLCEVVDPLGADGRAGEHEARLAGPRPVPGLPAGSESG